MMNKTNLKYLVPNGITFLSLTFGVGAILSAIQNLFILSGALIFTCYWLDMLDGYTARKLNAQSEFGLHMDSLTDMVSLGVAPAVLVFQNLSHRGSSPVWITPLVIIYTMAGAFRLARFNTLPAKTSSNVDSVGLTISQSGCTVTLAILADNVQPAGFLPILTYIPLLAILGILMVSRISFPPSAWFFNTHKFGRVLFLSLVVILIILPLFSTWFIYYLFYILISTGRALYHKLSPGIPT
jgi:CDP-diacylglycerol--serine O-phosphatidyltransferase